jgi:hypothetical protein
MFLLLIYLLAELIDLKALQILSESELRQLFEDLPIGVRVKLMEKIKKWQDRIVSILFIIARSLSKLMNSREN